MSTRVDICHPQPRCWRCWLPAMLMMPPFSRLLMSAGPLSKLGSVLAPIRAAQAGDPAPGGICPGRFQIIRDGAASELTNPAT